MQREVFGSGRMRGILKECSAGSASEWMTLRVWSPHRKLLRLFYFSAQCKLTEQKTYSETCSVKQAILSGSIFSRKTDNEEIPTCYTWNKWTGICTLWKQNLRTPTRWWSHFLFSCPVVLEVPSTSSHPLVRHKSWMASQVISSYGGSFSTAIRTFSSLLYHRNVFSLSHHRMPANSRPFQVFLASPSPFEAWQDSWVTL